MCRSHIACLLVVAGAALVGCGDNAKPGGKARTDAKVQKFEGSIPTSGAAVVSLQMSLV